MKFKLERQQEFVIRGYSPNGVNSLDAVLVGYYEGDALQFAGRARAGLVPFVRREVLAKLKPLRVPRCPFANLRDPSSGRRGSGVHSEEMPIMQWTKPEVVAQIRFVEWAADKRLRHAAFLGLRFDEAAGEVRRESSCTFTGPFTFGAPPRVVEISTSHQLPPTERLSAER